MFGKPKFTITLDKVTYVTGETVTARISVAERQSARAARVELLYVKSYEESSSDDGPPTQMEVDVVVDRTSLQEAASARALEVGEHVARLTIPPNAPPSVFRVDWRVRAILDLPRRPDVKAECDLRVLSRAAQYEQYDRDVASALDKADPQLHLDLPRIARVGEQLSGRLTVSAESDLSVSEIQIDLECGAKSPRMSDKGERIHLAGQEHFAAGESRVFPFSIAVAADASPTAYAQESQIHWRVVGTLSRPLRPDISARRELIIYNGPTG